MFLTYWELWSEPSEEIITSSLLFMFSNEIKKPYLLLEFEELVIGPLSEPYKFLLV